MLKSFNACLRWILWGAVLHPALALAQIGIPGSVTVSLSSPPQGADVDGSVTVVATTGGVGAGTVAGVRFLMDGFELGAEDTAPPYMVAWDTRGAVDGWHALTAVARTASGTSAVSERVTVRVSNIPPPPASVMRYEDTSPQVSYGPGWIRKNPGAWEAWSDDSATESQVSGSKATFSFSGTSVAWIGYRSADSGIARVLVDDHFIAEVDLFARRHEIGARVYSVSGLTNATHTLTIEVTGRRNPEATRNAILVDAFDVPAEPVARLQNTDPALAYTGQWTHLGGWFADSTRAWSDGTASISAETGGRATLAFQGTEIAWIGLRDVDTGIARVYLDGTPVATIDTYSPHPQIQDTLYAVSGLSDALPHTLEIEASGLSNSESAGSSIVIDALEVGSSGEWVQESDWSVTYTGTWMHDNRNRAWSEGTAAVAATAGATATFRFTGRSVSWIGFRAARTGIARVYIDGTLVADVDTYAQFGEGFQNTLYTATGLADGQHTLTIEATGTSNPAATDRYVVIDAFGVRR